MRRSLRRPTRLTAGGTARTRAIACTPRRWRKYPGLNDVVNAVVDEYDALFRSRPLEYHLAYIANLEATFTPTFKQLLDHADELFGPGDERVASLFLLALHRGDRAPQFGAHRVRPRRRSSVVPAAFAAVGAPSRRQDHQADNERDQQLRSTRCSQGGRAATCRPAARRGACARREVTDARGRYRPELSGGERVCSAEGTARRERSGCSVRRARTTIHSTSRCRRSPWNGSSATTAATTSRTGSPHGGPPDHGRPHANRPRHRDRRAGSDPRCARPAPPRTRSCSSAVRARRFCLARRTPRPAVGVDPNRSRRRSQFGHRRAGIASTATRTCPSTSS